jgi:hypothetical protein
MLGIARFDAILMIDDNENGFLLILVFFFQFDDPNGEKAERRLTKSDYFVNHSLFLLSTR